MFGSSAARIRQILVLTTLSCIVLLSVIIMGLVGVNGKITLPDSSDKGCLLYMTVDGNVASYNNGYCLFPIIAGAVTAMVALLLLIYLALVIHRKDEFSPIPMSMALVFLSGLMALLSFAMCGEIGLGLNKGCGILGDQIHSCRSRKNFSGKFLFFF